MADKREVLVLQHDLMTAMEGRPITVRTADGEEVVLRLYTADEFVAAQAEARQKVADDNGWTDEERDRNVPPVSRAAAEGLVKPLVLPR